jgi:hypothetical protein
MSSQLSLFRRTYSLDEPEPRAEELQPTNGQPAEPGEVQTAAVELSPEELAKLPVQPALFEKGEWWDNYWKGMPEFVQEDLAPVKTIYVHFETKEDYQAFAALVGQSLTMNTRSIWYPEAEIGRTFNKRYIDAPPPEEISDDIEIME